ncbi:uncharacterized protein LOC122814475 [Protopterus annectens]|uniref:uncharacterized protein LOC122814475 n=1 Tax=Protopterus annectens TaxID=7888 RepID=UPI001CF93A62|nr:uncharacterized protein LOC122814475 [Protopterus annectens]
MLDNQSGGVPGLNEDRDSTTLSLPDLILGFIECNSFITEVFQIPKVQVPEGHSAWLNCKFTTNKTIYKVSVEWHRGVPPNHILIYPESLYKDRVILDAEALINSSDASILFTNLTAEDSGTYYCKIGTIYNDVKGKGTKLVVLRTSARAITTWLACEGTGCICGIVLLILHVLVLHQCWAMKGCRKAKNHNTQEQINMNIKWTKDITSSKNNVSSCEGDESIYSLPH